MVFWGLFIVTGALIIAEALLGIYVIELLIGLVLLLAGIERLAVDMRDRVIMAQQERNNSKLDYTLSSLENHYDLSKALNDRHELRLFRLETRRQEAERQANRRLGQMERRLSKLEERMSILRERIKHR